MYTRILLPNLCNITMTHNEGFKFFNFVVGRYPILHTGITEQFTLYNIDELKNLCGVTHSDYANVDHVFLFDGDTITIYDSSQLLPVGNFNGIEKKNELPDLNKSDFANIMSLCKNMTNATVMIKNYPKIVKIFSNKTKIYDVLITLPTCDTLNKCHNYKEIIYIINVFKTFSEDMMVGDIAISIVKLIGFYNIVETYCENHRKDMECKRATFSRKNYREDIKHKRWFSRENHSENVKCGRVTFSCDNIEELAFKHVFEELLYNFIYGHKMI